jgi:Mrp family chromosome partitioning ATPase
MFDALRRAEAERRRRLASEPTVTPRIERREAPTAPAPGPTPRLQAPLSRPIAPAPEPSANGSDPFPGEMLRELGILRNSLESRLEKKTGRALMFTSAMHGEGTTTVAVAYARLLTLQGTERILLVELNARTPSLAARFGLAGREGVTHYFSSQRTLASLVHRPAHEGFDVVHVGDPDPAQIQIHLERSFPHLIEEALRSYDTVIIDAPPIVLCPETPPLAPFVDGVVLLVHCRRTKRETVERSIKQVQQFRGRVLGVVLNRKRYYIPDFIYRRV